MTATLAPFGLRPALHLSGQGRATRRPIAAAYTTAIYKGDLVIIADTGVNLAAANSGRGDGMFMGCEYTDPTGKRNVSPYWPGTASCTDIVAYINEDPNMLFDIQANGSVALSAIGSGFGISTANGTGSTATGLSLAALDTATVATSGNKQLIVVDLFPSEDNAWGDAFTIVRVKLGMQGFNGLVTAF